MEDSLGWSMHTHRNGGYGSANAPLLLETELLFRVMDRPPPKIARRFTTRTVVQLSLYGPWLGSLTDVRGNGMRRSTSEKGFSNYEKKFAPPARQLSGPGFLYDGQRPVSFRIRGSSKVG